MISQGKLSPEGRSVEPHVCDNFMFNSHENFSGKQLILISN